MGLFLDLFKGLLVICDTEQTSAPHSVLTCDVCLRMDSTNSSFKWRLQCTHCICDITCITLGGGQLLNNSRNIVCVLNFLCVIVYGVCVFVCLLCERDCTLCGVWLWFWPRILSLSFILWDHFFC